MKNGGGLLRARVKRRRGQQIREGGIRDGLFGWEGGRRGGEAVCAPPAGGMLSPWMQPLAILIPSPGAWPSPPLGWLRKKRTAWE